MQQHVTIDQALISRLKKINDTRILMVIVDGLGGLRDPRYKGTELQCAKTPNLDALVKREETVLGLLYPVARGVIPGSAAGHMALFGYNPLLKEHQIGRGILEAVDLGVTLRPGDVVARLNFATVKDGLLADRRAGRIKDASPLADELNRRVSIPEADFEVIATREYRGILLLRHKQLPLSSNVTDTDPGDEGKRLLRCQPRDDVDPAARRTASAVNSFMDQALAVLKTKTPANAIFLRGFSGNPKLRDFNEVYGLDAVAIADYPLYRGIARLVGMTLLPPAQSLAEKVKQLRDNYDRFTFFFFHYKEPDCRGEDGDFMGKVRALEDFDDVIPDILGAMKHLESDVIVITGDHSTPSVRGAHSHHSVPLLIYSAQNKGYDTSERFTEEYCTRGTLDRLLGVELMPNLLARANKLMKFDL